MTEDERSPPAVDIAQIEDQLERGFWRLRFMPALEEAFERSYLETGRPHRIALVVLAIVLVAMTPLYDSYLGAPADFNAYARPLQFLVQIPVLLVTLVLVARVASLGASEQAIIGSNVIVASGLFTQHAIGEAHGFVMPLQYTGITIAAVFFLARIRVRVLLPVAMALTVAMVIGEWLLVRPEPDGWNRVIATTELVILSAVGGYSLEHALRSAWLNQMLHVRLSEQDPLTGLLNYRAIENHVQHTLHQAARERRDIGLALIDLDRLKYYNDAYGHQVGDECLMHVAKILQGSSRRPLDNVARIGGDEFVVMWYDMPPAEAERRTRDLQRRLATLSIPGIAARSAEPPSVSVGLLAGVPSREASLSALLHVADRLMYKAKAQGRNAIAVDSL